MILSRICRPWAVMAVVCLFLTSSMSFGEIRKVTQEDIEWGDPSATVTSAGGHVGHKLSISIKNPPYIDVRDYLPDAYVTNGSVDYSTYIQRAIDNAYALGGGVVMLPPTMVYKAINLILKNGVILIGSPQGIGYLPSNITRTKLLAAGAGIVIDTPAGGATGAGVIGIDIQGLGAGTAVKGIRIRDGSWNQIKNVHIDNVSDEGIVIVAGLADIIEDVLVTNGVMDRTQSAVIGAVDIGGTDHYISRVEGTISGNTEGTIQSVNLYHSGIVIRGTNCFISNSVGELSDIGIYVSGSLNRFSNTRADLNYGHGFYVTGGSNQFANCTGMSNSQDTTNTYDNWHATSASANNIYSNCLAYTVMAKVVRYGFFDDVSGAETKNKYHNCLSIGAGTKGYLMNAVAGSIWPIPDGPSKSFTNLDATPSVYDHGRWDMVYSDNTTITNFDDGADGQRIIIKTGGAGTVTIEHGTNIFTNTGSNKELDNNKVYMFIKSGNYWFEL